MGWQIDGLPSRRFAVTSNSVALLYQLCLPHTRQDDHVEKGTRRPPVRYRNNSRALTEVPLGRVL
jgi:hypothetical protein